MTLSELIVNLKNYNSRYLLRLNIDIIIFVICSMQHYKIQKYAFQNVDILLD